jgi:hypothetical protein
MINVLDDQLLQSMMIILVEDRKEKTTNDAILKTISTRVAGGRREINTEPSRVSGTSTISLVFMFLYVNLGCCGYARVSFNFTIVSACLWVVGDPCDSDSWGLCLDARYCCREEESSRFNFEF